MRSGDGERHGGGTAVGLTGDPSAFLQGAGSLTRGPSRTWSWWYCRYCPGRWRSGPYDGTVTDRIHPSPGSGSGGGCGCGDEHPRRACGVAHVDPGDDVGRAWGYLPLERSREWGRARTDGNGNGPGRAGWSDRCARSAGSAARCRPHPPPQTAPRPCGPCTRGAVGAGGRDRRRGCPAGRPRSRTRSRIPPSASTAIPRPVRWTTDTISLLILWFTWVA
jgi:hypothetical protein